MNAEQARIASILAKAVAKYIRDDQRADYPLPSPVTIYLRSGRVARFVKAPYTVKDGSLSIAPITDDRIQITAHEFPRCGLWNGPDAIPNNTLRGMLASLFHDLIWEHADELAAAWGVSKLKVLRWGGDVLYLVWSWASTDSWWGRREAWLSFQATQFAAPVYHKAKRFFSKTTAVLIACGLCAGCAGCFSIPDGEVESVEGVEVVKQVMRDYGDGLGPDKKGEDDGSHAAK